MLQPLSVAFVWRVALCLSAFGEDNRIVRLSVYVEEDSLCKCMLSFFLTSSDCVCVITVEHCRVGLAACVGLYVACFCALVVFDFVDIVIFYSRLSVIVCGGMLHEVASRCIADGCLCASGES